MKSISVPIELLEDMLNPCADFATHERLRAILDNPVVESEFEPDAVCTESDGCPTEGAVLKRFWRENQPDTELCKFYEAEDCQSLVKELVGHVAQLQDAVKRNVKPWEDTFPPTLLPAYIARINAEQPAPVAKSRCEQVPFSMLCYGAKFKYTPGESAVFVKIGPDLVAGWDGQKVADGWIGQPVCSFSDDGNLLAAVTLVHEQAEPVAKLHAERLTGKDGEYGVTVEDSEWFNSCRQTGGIFNLYAEPPAPVAVVMPERMKTEPFTTIDRGSKNYKAGYNAAIAEIAKLNGIKP